MANLVEVAEELEYVPKEQLIQMAQEPNSRFPSYMVLSEIQRRTQMERMYNAERMEKPTTTVAEELVGEFAQPQGLAGMAADGLATPANDFSTSAPPASPMQMAAIGGRTGYADKGKTEPLYRKPMAFGGDKGYDIMTSLIRDPASNQLISQKEYNQLYPPAPPAEKSFFETIAGKASKAINRPSKIEQIKNAGLEALVGGHIDAMEKGEQASMKFIADNMGIMNRATLREMVRSHKNKFPEKKGLGGRVGYQNLGATGDARLQLLTSLGIDPTGMSEAQIEDALLFASTREQEQKPLTQVNTGVDRPVDLATEEPGFFEGLYDDVSESYLGQLAKDYAKETYYDDEGDFKYGAAALDAATFIPGIGLGLGLAGKTLYKGLPAAYKYLKGIDYADKARKTGRVIDKTTKPFYTSPRKVVKTKAGKEIDADSSKGRFAQNIGGAKPYRSKTLRDVSLPRIAVTTSVGGLAGREVYDYMQSDAKATEDAETEPSKKDLDNKIEEIVPDDKTNKGLKGKVKSYIDQADGLDIAKLGGIIMSARNMSELGAGIAGLASDIQERRLTEDELENRKSLQGIQGKLYEAQADKVQAEIEALPAEQVNSLLTQYAAYAKAINDGNINLEGEELERFSLAYQALLDKANKLQGIETLSKADQLKAALEAARI